MMRVRELMLAVMVVIQATADNTTNTTTTALPKVYCPPAHCLQRVAKGNLANSFQCQQYPDKGYQCAIESDPRQCTCNGKVKYGNTATAGANATWSKDHNVTTKIACTNKVFGDPISGSKFCYCMPSSPFATSRSTKPASDSTANNYVAPTCIITDVLSSAIGMVNSALWATPFFVNSGLVNSIVKEGVHAVLKTKNSRWISFDTSTFLATLQIDCSISNSCFGGSEIALNKMYNDRAATAKLIEVAAKAFIATYGKGAVKQLGPALVMSLKPDTFSDATTVTTTTKMLTGVVKTATVFTASVTLQLADPAAFVASTKSKGIMAHSIAASNADIKQEYITINSITLARRLSASPRGLAAGGVKVDYTVTFPKTVSSPVFTKASIDTTKLTAAIQTKSKALGMTVSVTSVVVADPVVTSTQVSGATASTGLLAIMMAAVMAAFAA